VGFSPHSNSMCSIWSACRATTPHVFSSPHYQTSRLHTNAHLIASKHHCSIQMPPKPRQSRALKAPLPTHFAPPKSLDQNASNSSLPSLQSQCCRRSTTTATSSLSEGPDRDTASDDIDWTFIPNAHDSLHLDIISCWNCSAPLHASSLFECPECLLPN
jgi:hypothetical protein